MTKSFKWILILGAALFASACTVMVDAPALSECTSDSQCDSPLVCDTATGYCVVDGNGASAACDGVSLVFTPETWSGTQGESGAFGLSAQNVNTSGARDVTIDTATLASSSPAGFSVSAPDLSMVVSLGQTKEFASLAIGTTAAVGEHALILDIITESGCELHHTVTVTLDAYNPCDDVDLSFGLAYYDIDLGSTENFEVFVSNNADSGSVQIDSIVVDLDDSFDGVITTGSVDVDANASDPSVLYSFNATADTGVDTYNGTLTVATSTGCTDLTHNFTVAVSDPCEGVSLALKETVFNADLGFEEPFGIFLKNMSTSDSVTISNVTSVIDLALSGTGGGDTSIDIAAGEEALVYTASTADATPVSPVDAPYSGALTLTTAGGCTLEPLEFDVIVTDPCDDESLSLPDTHFDGARGGDSFLVTATNTGSESITLNSELTGVPLPQGF
ncbi:hypothetical protein KAI87_12865, partial [Myxococcota bacterium]|nr:hypothetical protein [Myxococcota bacterium]